MTSQLESIRLSGHALFSYVFKTGFVRWSTTSSTITQLGFLHNASTAAKKNVISFSDMNADIGMNIYYIGYRPLSWHIITNGCTSTVELQWLEH